MSISNYQIEKDECKEIRELHEKRLALENLAKILKPNSMSEMYERVISDYGKTVTQFDAWWANIFKKYKLPPGEYSVDFENNALILVAENQKKEMS